MPDDARIRSVFHAPDLQQTLLQAIEFRKGGGAPAEAAALCRRYSSLQPHHPVLLGAAQCVVDAARRLSQAALQLLERGRRIMMRGGQRFISHQGETILHNAGLPSGSRATRTAM